MKKNRLCTGVVGAGAISDIYLKNMTERCENLYVKSICAGHMESARKKAEIYGIAAATLEEMVSDPEIDLIVNLTPVYTHYEIIKKALLHGKHVYTEKTMTDDLEKSAELAALAQEKGLYLGSAPDTFMGAALQRARSAIDDGILGEINSFAISGNRNNDMLLSAYAYLRKPGAGIVCDYGVYYVTALVSLLGPVKRVGSMVRAPYPTHVNTKPGDPLQGQVMDTPNESEVCAIIQMESGVTGTLHINADSIFADEAYFFIYGKKGILALPDPNQFNGKVQFIPQPEVEFWKRAVPVTLWNFGPGGDNLRGIGPSDLAGAVLAGNSCRPSGELAYHVQEVLAAMLSGGENGAFTDIISTCRRPEPTVPRRVPVKKIAHLAYQVKNMEAMLHFYEDVLGMEKYFTLTFRDLYDSVEEWKKELPPGEDPLLDQIRKKGDQPWIEYLRMAEGQFVELFYDTDGIGATEADNRWDHYGYLKMNYEVEDIQALRDRLVKAGVEIEDDIHQAIDGGIEVKVHDPEGNEVQFTQYPKSGDGLLRLKPDADVRSCSGVNGITQVAYQVKDERNMLNYYTKGLGLKHAARLTFKDLADSMEAGGFTGDMLLELRKKGELPWIDYIEVAPRQFIELFYTGGQEKKEASEGGYGYQHICLEAEDIHEAWEAVTSNGIQPDTEISVGCDHTRVFWVKDPDGNRMEFHEYTENSRQLRK